MLAPERTKRATISRLSACTASASGVNLVLRGTTPPRYAKQKGPSATTPARHTTNQWEGGGCADPAASWRLTSASLSRSSATIPTCPCSAAEWRAAAGACAKKKKKESSVSSVHELRPRPRRRKRRRRRRRGRSSEWRGGDLTCGADDGVGVDVGLVVYQPRHDLLPPSVRGQNERRGAHLVPHIHLTQQQRRQRRRRRRRRRQQQQQQHNDTTRWHGSQPHCAVSASPWTYVEAGGRSQEDVDDVLRRKLHRVV